MQASSLILLIIYQLKNLVCNYPFQTDTANALRTKGYATLLVYLHALLHGTVTFLIVKLLFEASWMCCIKLSVLDAAVRFTLEYLKEWLDRNGKLAKFTDFFWNTTEIDHYLNGLTHYLIIWMLTK
jgi:hypothetical protein